MMPSPQINNPEPITISFCAKPGETSPITNVAIPAAIHATPATPKENTTEPITMMNARKIITAAIASGMAMGEANIPSIASHTMEPKPFVVFFSCCSSIFLSVVLSSYFFWCTEMYTHITFRWEI